MPGPEEEVEFDLSDFDLAFMGDEVNIGLVDEEDAPTVKITSADIGAFDVIKVGYFGQTVDYTRQFLANTREPFHSAGLGDYACILQWPHSRLNSEDVERHINAFRAQLSRLRKENPGSPPFVAVLDDYRILEDNKHVYIKMARMTTDLYEDYLRLKREAKVSTSTVSKLKDYM